MTDENKQYKPTTFLSGLVTQPPEKKTSRSGKPFVVFSILSREPDGAVRYWELQEYRQEYFDWTMRFQKSQWVAVEGVNVSSEWNGKVYYRLWIKELRLAPTMQETLSTIWADVPF